MAGNGGSGGGSLRQESLKAAASLGGFGMFLAVSLVFAYVIGGWMDGAFDTSPVFRVFWIVCAVIASVLEFVRAVRAARAVGAAGGHAGREDGDV